MSHKRRGRGGVCFLKRFSDFTSAKPMGGFKTFTTPKDLLLCTRAKIYYRATSLRWKADEDFKSLFYTKSTLLVFSSNNQHLQPSSELSLQI